MLRDVQSTEVVQKPKQLLLMGTRDEKLYRGGSA